MSIETLPEVTMSDFVESKQIPVLYPELFTPQSWQWLQNQRNNNGLHSAFKKVGRSLYVNTKTLAQCMDNLEGKRVAR